MKNVSTLSLEEKMLLPVTDLAHVLREIRKHKRSEAMMDKVRLKRYEEHRRNMAKRLSL